MRLNVCTVTGALALAALLTPSTAHAQNLAKEVISGEHAPHTVPVTVGNGEGARVIRSQAEAVAAGLYALIPPNWVFQPNWNQEMYVLAVDQRGSGPGAVSIHAEERDLVSTPFFTVSYLQITVKRLVPQPGTIGTPSTIRPFSLVKLPRTNLGIQIRVRDEMMAAPPPPLPTPAPSPMIFTGVLRQMTHQPAINWTGPGGAPNVHRATEQVDVRADGRVVISRWSTPSVTGTPPITGTATQAELQALNRALRRARLNGIPSQLGAGGFPHFSLTGFGLPAGDKTVAGVRGAEGQFKPRLDPVHAALDAIRDRLTQPPPAPPAQVSFNTVSRRIRNRQRRRRVSLAVDAAGNATLTIRRRQSPPRTIRGTLTADERRQLSRAVRRSRLSRVPSQLSVPVTGPAPRRFELTVDARRPRNSNTVRGRVGHYGPHAGSVEPIMQVLDAITARLRNGGGGSGPVPLHGGGNGLTHGLNGATNNP